MWAIAVTTIDFKSQAERLLLEPSGALAVLINLEDRVTWRAGTLIIKKCSNCQSIDQKGESQGYKALDFTLLLPSILWSAHWLNQLVSRGSQSWCNPWRSTLRDRTGWKRVEVESEGENGKCPTWWWWKCYLLTSSIFLWNRRDHSWLKVRIMKDILEVWGERRCIEQLLNNIGELKE